MAEANPDNLTLEERVARLEARVFSPCCQAVEDAKRRADSMIEGIRCQAHDKSQV